MMSFFASSSLPSGLLFEQHEAWVRASTATTTEALTVDPKYCGRARDEKLGTTAKREDCNAAVCSLVVLVVC